LQVPDFTTYSWLFSLFIQNWRMCNCAGKCVAFPEFHSSLSLCPWSALPAILGPRVHCQIIRKHPHEILPLH